jgi:hypothetical protein
MKNIVIAAVLFFTCSLSQANGVYAIGSVNVICADFIKSESSRAEFFQTAQWVAGLITSFNFYSTNKQSAPATTDALPSRLEPYCLQHPKKPILDAAAALVQHFRSEQ